MPYRTIEVLLVGTQRLPDGRTVSFDRARIARVCRQANAQLAAGIRIPFSWMHRPGARPVYMSQDHPQEWLAKGYFGEPVKLSQDAATGNLLARVWIPDEADAKQFDKVGQVSPGLISNWVDDRNVFWPDLTLIHVAATPRPVQRDVSRVGKYPAPFLMSHPADADAYLLSFPATPRSEPMADEKDKTDETPEGAGGGSMDLSEVIDLLKNLDIHGMDGVSDYGTLVAALKAAVHTKLGDAGEGGEPEGDEITPEDLEEVPAPMLMSHPAVRGWVAQVGKAAHDSRVRDLKDCLAEGRITRAIHDKELQRLTAVNLSQPTADHFHADGTLKATEFDVRLGVYKSLPKGNTQAGSPIEMSHPVEAVPNPTAQARQTDTQKSLDKAVAHAAQLRTGK